MPKIPRFLSVPSEACDRMFGRSRHPRFFESIQSIHHYRLCHADDILADCPRKIASCSFTATVTPPHRQRGCRSIG